MKNKIRKYDFKLFRLINKSLDLYKNWKLDQFI
jgi:hypothetical protein